MPNPGYGPSIFLQLSSSKKDHNMVWKDAEFGFFRGGIKLKTGAGSGNFNYERERDFVFFYGVEMRDS